jgi:hypothetical protein
MPDRTLGIRIARVVVHRALQLLVGVKLDQHVLGTREWILDLKRLAGEPR